MPQQLVISAILRPLMLAKRLNGFRWTRRLAGAGVAVFAVSRALAFIYPEFPLVILDAGIGFPLTILLMSLPGFANIVVSLGPYAVWPITALSCAMFGALLGFPFDCSERAVGRAALVSGIMGVGILAALAPVFPWGMNAVQYTAAIRNGARINQMRARADASDEALDSVLADILTSAERGGSLRDLRDLLNGRQVPQSIADRHAPTLVRIIESRRASIGAPDAHAVQLFVYFSKAPEAKMFILATLGEPSSHLRHAVVRYLNWTRSWVGDAEIFEALHRLYVKEGDVERSVLAAMQTVDNAKSLPVLKSALLAATDERTYQGLASLVYRTKDNDLFETELMLMGKFGVPVWAKKEQFDSYFAVAEGDKLSETVKTLCSPEHSRILENPKLLEKLDSTHPKSRAAAYDAVGCLIKNQYIRGKENLTIKKMLVGASSEPDTGARAAAKRALSEWELRKFLH